MTKSSVAIIPHVEDADITWIVEALRDRGLSHEVIRPFLGEPLPGLDECGAVICVGGPQSAYRLDQFPYLATERDFLRSATEAGIPVLAICLGAQLLAAALGGEAVAGDHGLECGFIDVEADPAAMHPLLPQLQGRYFSFHSDSLVPPPAAEVLAVSDRYVQAWAHKSALAVQFHPEMSADGVRRLIGHEAEKLAASGIDSEYMLAAARENEAASRRRCEQLIGGWLDLNTPAHRPRTGIPDHKGRHAMSSNSAFIERHDIYSAEQSVLAEETLARADELGIEVIRLAWPDQHGLLRGKNMSRDGYASALRSGVEITMAPFFFDTANAIVFNPFSPGGGFDMPELSGSPNVVMVPDPATFRVLPWAPETAWVMCDLHMRDGSPFPFAPRSILRKTLDELATSGYRLIAGLEMEWYLTRLLDDNLSGSLGAPGSPGDPPAVSPVARGYNYLLGNHLDEIDDALRPIRKAVESLGLPLRSFDDEWAPSQVETTFDVLEGLQAADSAALFRMAVKQVARRNGYVASFMCTPAIEGFYASGWHLHTSLVDTATGKNLMVPEDGQPLSDLGRYYVGGTLAHGVAASAFTTPTVNGYRRRRPYSLAPDRLTWAFDNRAAMMRVISAAGDPSSHVENRVGDSGANPYLYLASQAAAGLDGVLNKIEPGPISEDPYAAEVAQLPQSLGEALDALEADQFFRKAFGDRFIDYLFTMKRSEVDRYTAWVADHSNEDEYVNGVTDWEHREYFELF